MSNSNDSLLTFEAIIDDHNRAYMAEENAKAVYLDACKRGDVQARNIALGAMVEARASASKCTKDMDVLVSSLGMKARSSKS